MQTIQSSPSSGPIQGWLFTVRGVSAVAVLTALHVASFGCMANHTCVDEYSRQAGYGIDPPNTLAGPANLGELEAMCIQEGEGCPSEQLISYNAAACVARQDGLRSGPRDYFFGLTFDQVFRRPVWRVLNVTYDEGAEVGGEWRTVDALNGQVLDSTSWSVIFD